MEMTMTWRITGATHPKTKSAAQQVRFAQHSGIDETCKTAEAHASKQALVVG